MRIWALLCLAIFQSIAMATPETPQAKYEAVYSFCHAVGPVSDKNFPLANKLLPGAPVALYFLEHRAPVGSVKPFKYKLTEQTKHGKLVDSNGGYVYYPNEGYLGPDQMTVVIAAQGKKFKVIVSIWVESVARAYASCPKDYKLPPAE